MTAKDAMGMTPLHVLCSNPSATTDMIKQLTLKNPTVSQEENIYGMAPLDIYLVRKGIISLKDH